MQYRILIVEDDDDIREGIAIYLLLRRSVDATPFSEVLLLGPAAAEPRALSDIKLDNKGAPEMAQEG